MKYGASIRNRHIVAKFDKGEEIIETLRRLCVRERIKAAVFTGFGTLTSAELQEFNPHTQVYEEVFRSENLMQAPSLLGNISVLGNELIIEIQAILKYSVYGQVHLVSGILSKARVNCIELHLVMFEDIVIERSFDMHTGMAPWSKIQSTIESEYSYSDSSLALEFMASSDRIDKAIDNNAAARREPQVLHRRRKSTAEIMASNTELSLPPAVSNLPSDDDSKAADKGKESAEAEEEGSLNREEWVKKRRRQVASVASDTGLGVFKVDSFDTLEKASSNLGADIEPKVGDFLIHPTLGKCRVEKILEDALSVEILETKTLKTIKLQFFELNKDIEAEETTYILRNK